jgi:hypothetical protein
MAIPALAASVRKGIERTPMTAAAKFRTGELLHNHDTNEDGLATRVYELEGAVMYEVVMPATLAGTHYVSDWPESALELYNNVKPKNADRPPRD